MSAQFDLCRLARGGLVVVVQSDLLDHLAVRVVIPLFPPGPFGRAMSRLNPEISFGDQRLVLSTQLVASIPVSELRDVVGNLSEHRDIITRAVDTLLAGV